MDIRTARDRAPSLLTALATLAILVAACGSSAPAGPADGDPRPDVPSSIDDGGYADEAELQAAIGRLAELESFSYETVIGASSLGQDYLVTITGVEHPLAGDRALHASRNDGVDWSSMSVDGAFFADIGRGLEALDPREDAEASTDPQWIANLVSGAFGVHWDDFVVAGEETIDGRAVRHYSLDDHAIEQILQFEDEGGYETFSGDLWVDAADGYLVKAHFGRLPFGTTDFLPISEFTFELSDVGCACPISAPS